MEEEAQAVERQIASGRGRAPAALGLPPTVALQVGGRSESTFSTAAYLPLYAPSSLVPSGATRVAVRGGEVKAGVDARCCG